MQTSTPEQKFIDVWFASEQDILQNCRDIAKADIKKISTSDPGYKNYSNHAKEFLSCGHKEGWQIIYSFDPAKPELTTESCTAYPLPTAVRALRNWCNDYQIFNSFEEAESHFRFNCDVMNEIECQKQIIKERQHAYN
jgi:hypothetical protein